MAVHRWNHRGPNSQRQWGGTGWGWQRIRAAVLKRDGGVCRWCGGKAVTADHVLAVARGGSDEMDNLVAACGACNERRRQELQGQHGPYAGRASRKREPEPHPGVAPNFNPIHQRKRAAWASSVGTRLAVRG